MSEADKRNFLKEYTRVLREGGAALFVGAGISRSAGYVDWKLLLKEIAEELELDIDRETDFLALAQFHVNHRKTRDRLSQLLIDEFLQDVSLTPAHRLIALLPVPTIWTTNYDELIELALIDAQKTIDVKRRPQDLSVTRRRKDVTIYKMHGDITSPTEAILTKDDYETYDTTRELFSIALKADLAEKTFLFLGFSFSDPNIMYILGRVKHLLEENSRKHYCLLKAPRPETDGEYQCKRFSHWLVDLHRYNIQPILVEEYNEVPELLKELNRRSHLRDIFISGSAIDFTPLGEEKFQELCHLLGKELIEKDFNIISGFGSGVDDLVVIGAMDSLRRNDDERLKLWPFPQRTSAGVDRAAFQHEYRERMISQAGICIVLAGNKVVHGETVLADGVRQEVGIARFQGKPIIPVGSTGYVALEVWEEVQANPTSFYGNTDVATELSTLKDPTQSVPALVHAIIGILKKLDK
jgi:hypothetical protein